jgi:hypothetical protein
MDSKGAREERLHRRVVERLPWYVNGTLAAAEWRSVDEHVASCALCRAELDAARELGRAVKSAEAFAPSPHPVQLDRLLARIDAYEAGALPGAEIEAIAKMEETEDPPGSPEERGRFFLPPRRMRQLLVAELAAILVLTCGLAWQRHLAAPAAPPALYRTLSSDAPIAAAPGTMPIRVLFAGGATAARVQEILAGIRGQITSGPSPVGAYVVAVPAGPGADPVEVVLAHLRAQPEVSFAARVAGAGGG